MATESTVCSIHPYFRIREGQEDAVRSYCERFVEMTGAESGCLYYGFSLDGADLHCREAYDNADALLAHLGNVGGLLQEMLQTSADLERVEVHGPEAELAKLREPLTDLSPRYYALEYEYRR